MKFRLFASALLLVAPFAAMAGKPTLSSPMEFSKHSVNLVAEWSFAFENLLERDDLTLEQEQIIWRALNMSTVDMFEVKNLEAYDATLGVAIRSLMDDVRANFKIDDYILLMQDMPQTQWFLMSIQAMLVPICNCADLCDCNDVAPRYSRCQSTPCLSAVGSNINKVCQYTP